MLPTFEDVLDGETFDSAGPLDGSAHPVPPTDRVWVAQGRQRLALRATTRERMETRTFTAFDGVHKEQPIAVEFGNQYRRLYTLTSDDVPGSSQPSRWTLYVESTTGTASPAAPEQKAVLKFVDQCWNEPVADCDHPGELHWPGWDPLEDIELWELSATQDLIVARSQKRVVTVRLNAPSSGSWSFEIRGWARELFREGRGPNVTWSSGEPWLHDSSGTIDPYKVALLKDLALGLDAQGRLMAFVLAEAGGWGVQRPLPEVMVACDLDSANQYANPTFDFDPSANVHYRVFNPMAGVVNVGQTATAEQKAQNKAYGLDAYAVGTSPPSAAYVYLACGRNQQVQRVEVSDLHGLPGNQTVFLAGTKIDVTNVPPSTNLDELFNVVADPDAPHTRMYLIANQDFYLWDNSSGTPVVRSTDHIGTGGYPERETCGGGLARDGFVMRGLPVGTGTRTGLWAAFHDQVDHIGKVFDLSVPPPAGHVTLIDQFYGIFASDGGVAVGNEVYLPTFGGVARYALVNGKYQYAGNAASFQPAEDPSESGLVNLTEHTEQARVKLSNNDFQDHVLTASAQAGAFSLFVINDPTKDLFPSKRINPNQDKFNQAIETTLACDSCTGGSVPCPYCLVCPVDPLNPNCQGTPLSYGNDIVHVDMEQIFGAPADNKLLLTDLTKYVVPGHPGKIQIILTIYRWNAFQQQPWQHLASVASSLIPVSSEPQTTLSITVAKHPTSGKLFAFVSHDEGVAVFDVDGLPRKFTDPLGTLAYTGQSVPSLSWVSALAVVQDRVFFIENGSKPKPPFRIPGSYAQYPNGSATPNALLKLQCYQWTTAATDPLVYRSTLYLDGTLPPTTAPDSPGPGIRARVRQLPGGSGSYTHDVYVAGFPYLTKWSWPGNNGPDQLDLTGYWRSDYDLWLQDCRIVELTIGGQTNPYVLAVRDRGSFAIVGPIQ